jgi:hypothetical protein
MARIGNLLTAITPNKKESRRSQNLPLPVSNPDPNAHLKQSQALGHRRRRRSPKFRRPQAEGKSRRRQKIRSRNEGLGRRRRGGEKDDTPGRKARHAVAEDDVEAHREQAQGGGQPPPQVSPAHHQPRPGTVHPLRLALA